MEIWKDTLKYLECFHFEFIPSINISLNVTSTFSYLPSLLTSLPFFSLFALLVALLVGICTVQYKKLVREREFLVGKKAIRRNILCIIYSTNYEFEQGSEIWLTECLFLRTFSSYFYFACHFPFHPSAACLLAAISPLLKLFRTTLCTVIVYPSS